jgi:hypothetical protein
MLIALYWGPGVASSHPPDDSQFTLLIWDCNPRQQLLLARKHLGLLDGLDSI